MLGKEASAVYVKFPFLSEAGPPYAELENKST